MADRIDIFEIGYSYIIAWNDDDGSPGAALGDGFDDPEHRAAEKAVASLKTHTYGSGDLWREAYAWETKTDAIKALRAARAAIKAERAKEKPWPSWAITATAEGWKPPKGWKPK